MAEYSAYGTKISIESAVPGTYTDIGQVRDINGPSMSTTAIETTHRGGSGWKSFVGGLRDAGEVTFDIVFDPDLTTHKAGTALSVLTVFAAASANNWRLTFPDTTPATATFSAVVTGFAPSAPMDDALTASVTLKVSGSLTWA